MPYCEPNKPVKVSWLHVVQYSRRHSCRAARPSTIVTSFSLPTNVDWPVADEFCTDWGGRVNWKGQPIKFTDGRTTHPESCTDGQIAAASFLIQKYELYLIVFSLRIPLFIIFSWQQCVHSIIDIILHIIFLCSESARVFPRWWKLRGSQVLANRSKPDGGRQRSNEGARAAAVQVRQSRYDWPERQPGHQLRQPQHLEYIDG